MSGIRGEEDRLSVEVENGASFSKIGGSSEDEGADGADGVGGAGGAGGAINSAVPEATLAPSVPTSVCAEFL